MTAAPDPAYRSPVGPTDWLLFGAVLLGCFGSFAVTSILMIATDPSGALAEYAYAQSFSLLGLVASELFAGLLAIVALAACGWRAADLPFRLTWRDTALALGLAVFVILVSWSLWGPPLTEANESPAALGLSLPLMLILLVSVVNPLFEETFVVGFVMRFLEWRGVPRWPLVALCVSVVIRVAYHLYQGVDAIPLHLFMAILFAGMFLWRRNLWPLVLAHGLLNLQGFLPYLL